MHTDLALKTASGSAAERPQPATGRAQLPWGPMLRMSAKLALAQLAPLLMSLYLAGLIARRDEHVFASYSLVTSINVTLFITFSSFLQVLYYMGGRALGTGAQAEYRAALRAGIAVSFAAGLFSCAVSMLIGPALGALGLNAALVSPAATMGLVAAAGLLPALPLVVFRVHAALCGSAGLASALATAGALLGIGAAALLASLTADASVLAHQLLWAVAAVQWAMLGVAALALRRVRGLDLAPLAAQPQPAPSLPTMWRVGWPVGAVVLLDSMCMLSSSLAMGRFWPDALPIHGVVTLCVTVGLIVPLGIAQAAVQSVAIKHAEGDAAARNAAARAALAYGALWGLVAMAVFALAAEPLGAVFMSPAALDVQARQWLRQFMPLAGAVLALQGLIVIAAAVLRGIGQTRAPLLQAAIGYLVFGAGGQIAFGLGLGWGAVGLWAGLILGFFVTAVAVLWRCYSQLRLAPLSPASADPSSDLQGVRS